jgi:hypothetical protein
MYKRKSIVYIKKIIINKKHRKKGTGKEKMKITINYAEEKNVIKLYCK